MEKKLYTQYIYMDIHLISTIQLPEYMILSAFK